jgi:hypothetical protein
MFLTNPAFREQHGNVAPVLIWLLDGNLFRVFYDFSRDP